MIVEENTRKNKEKSQGGGIFALGNFDGVHLGHQAVIKTALDVGKSKSLPVRVLTLEPHPRTLFLSPQAPFRLTLSSVKNRLLQNMGVEEIITLEFSYELAKMLPREFVEKILVGHYCVDHIVAGEDFAFGRDRSGTMLDMQNWLASYGIGVTAVPPFKDETGEVVSSSRLRESIHQGDWETARKLLGRDWSIVGVVEKGAERGRNIGVPTANIDLGEIIRPPFGVYAVKARQFGKANWYGGVANIGVRPTVDGVKESLEFHLFDFNQNIYEQEWEVSFVQFIRQEKKFPDIEKLREQIVRDIKAGKEILGYENKDKTLKPEEESAHD